MSSSPCIKRGIDVAAAAVGLVLFAVPMLAVAVAEADRVMLAARGGRGPLGLSLGSLFALFGLAEEGAAAYEVPEPVETPARTAA